MKPKLEQQFLMIRTAVFLLLMASVAAADGQTAAKTDTHCGFLGLSRNCPVRTAPGVPAVKGPVFTAFSLRYQEIEIGTGAAAEPNKLYRVLYTGYLASSGQVFDSSADHRAPLIKDGKPVMGADGKPELGPPQPLVFPQGYGRLIPGFDQGFAGMRVGGKRRLFVPWQLAYGTRDIPARGPGHPGIPPKSDLIFDVELVGVTDMPQMPPRPTGAAGHPGAPSR